MLVSLIGVGRLFFGLLFLGLFVTCVLHLVSWGCSGCGCGCGCGFLNLFFLWFVFFSSAVYVFPLFALVNGLKNLVSAGGKNRGKDWRWGMGGKNRGKDGQQHLNMD